MTAAIHFLCWTFNLLNRIKGIDKICIYDTAAIKSHNTLIAAVYQPCILRKPFLPPHNSTSIWSIHFAHPSSNIPYSITLSPHWEVHSAPLCFWWDTLVIDRLLNLWYLFHYHSARARVLKVNTKYMKIENLNLWNMRINLISYVRWNKAIFNYYKDVKYYSL